MDLPQPLYRGRLIKRYKRFLADIVLDNGDEITAHVANSGAMAGLKDEGLTVYVSRSDNPKRKLAYSWELVDLGEAGLVGIHTGYPNKIVEEAILGGDIAELTGYETLRREVKYGINSRIDLLLEDPNKPLCYVEVKNVHLKRGDDPVGVAEFPDAVTARGAKHLDELSEMVRQGHRAVMVYLVQREDCDRFDIAQDIDPKYRERLDAALAAGVEAICYQCKISTSQIRISHAIPLALTPWDR